MDCPVCKNPLLGPKSAPTDKSPEPILYYVCTSPPSKCPQSGQRYDLRGNKVDASVIEDAVVKTNEDEGLS